MAPSVSIGYAYVFVIGYQLVSTVGEVLVFVLVAADVLKLWIEEGNDLVS